MQIIFYLFFIIFKMEKKKLDESYLDTSDTLSIYQTETVLGQMKNCVCKIEIENRKGRAFFCNINISKNIYIPILITALHTLNGTKSKFITIYLNNGNEKKEIFLDNKRIKYEIDDYDMVIIEIKPQDKIKNDNFLELDKLDNNIKDEDFKKRYDKKLILFCNILLEVNALFLMDN